MNSQYYDVIIIGAGAAGLMAAAVAGMRGKSVLLLESTSKIGEKIRISGGGRCNFTNIGIDAKRYISSNPHFVKSALASYSQFDFIKLVEKHKIAYHEKTLGQLFCDGSSAQIIDMLTEECLAGGVELKIDTYVADISKTELFQVTTNIGSFTAKSLIVATGGLSIPKIGASDFGYKIAAQFGLDIIAPKPALVPLIVAGEYAGLCTSLAGVSIFAEVSYGKASFRENILFTHRGLSGPAILQISSYLEEAAQIKINLLPDLDLRQILLAAKTKKGNLSSILKLYLPRRFVEYLFANENKNIADYKNSELVAIVENLHNFSIRISGNEGYAKAEVTAGGVDTKMLSSKTMETRSVPGLYFIGEVIDVTGWLGGYNFQWAWSSGYVAGMSV